MWLLKNGQTKCLYALGAVLHSIDSVPKEAVPVIALGATNEALQPCIQSLLSRS